MKRKEQTAFFIGLSERKLAVIGVFAAALVVSGVVLSSFLWRAQKPTFSFKAAIVDQLGGKDQFPNPEFNETGSVASMLREAGFNVTYYRSENVTVNFYRELAKKSYGIILLRTHAAVRTDESLVDLFTSERFKTGIYEYERNNNLLTGAYYSWKPGIYYFAVTYKFIENIEGIFPQSLIIAMGCNTLNENCTEMAEAFIRKGAQAYLGWTGWIQPSHMDNETIKLLRGFLVEGKTLNQVVTTALPDPDGSRIDLYPSAAGNLTLAKLSEEKASVNEGLICSFEKGLPITGFLSAPVFWKRFRTNDCGDHPLPD
ncbi:MAG: hypothetical protein QHH24_03435 [Candidatus Bathyarchaeota archaeon]|nr:hypothetical protein [Candidatus Bathyarchaeota archaeon]